MERYGYFLIAGLLCLSAFAHAQEQETEDYVQAVTASLQEKTGKKPTSQDIVSALNRWVFRIYQKGHYYEGEMVAEQTYQFAERKLGPEHHNTLNSANNLALYHFFIDFIILRKPPALPGRR